MPKLALKLNDVINDQWRAQHFYRFAKKQFCGENVDFLYACRQLNGTLGPAVFGPIPVNLASQGAGAAARYIYDRFILATGTSSARVQVNIDSGTKRAIDLAATQGQLGAATFNQGYDHVWRMVEGDTWKKFAAPNNEHVATVRAYWDNNQLRGFIQY